MGLSNSNQKRSNITISNKWVNGLFIHMFIIQNLVSWHYMILLLFILNTFMITHYLILALITNTRQAALYNTKRTNENDANIRNKISKDVYETYIICVS